MLLHVKKLEYYHSHEFDGFYAIYSTAFPVSEQKSSETLHEMLKSENYTIYLAHIDEKIIGFSILYHPQDEDFYLLEYMAISNLQRGGGWGTMLLQKSIDDLFKTHGTKALIIEIDSPEKPSDEQEIREKREQFYRRFGAKKIDPFDYILPLQTHETPPPMELLVYHPSLQTLSKELLQHWLEKLYTNVYGCDKHDARIAFMLEHTPPILNLI